MQKSARIVEMSTKKSQGVT